MKNIKTTQIAQNKMLRLLDGSRVKDKRTTKDMLEKFEILSINQTIAQIKLTEAWKASKDDNYPIKLRWTRENVGETEQRNTRQTARHTMREGGNTMQAEKSFMKDIGKIWWNQAPKEIKEAKTIGVAKNLLKNTTKRYQSEDKIHQKQKIGPRWNTRSREPQKEENMKLRSLGKPSLKGPWTK